MLTSLAQAMSLKPLPWMWMSWWYDPWLGEMELTVGVAQAAVLKERPFEVLLVCWHCGVATHWVTALETRREPEGETISIWISTGLCYFLLCL